MVQGFVSTDPLRNTPPPVIEGNARDQADAQRLHEDLLNSSEAYRDAYQRAVWNAPAGEDGKRQSLTIKFVSADDPSQQDGKRRSAGYDPSSHTIYLRASTEDRDAAALEKLATNLALETFNASRGNAYSVAEDRIEDALKKSGADKNKVVDRAVTEILDLERQSLSDYDKFRAEASGKTFRLGNGDTATFGTLNLDSNTPPTSGPTDSDEHADKKPKPNKQSNAQFYRSQIESWLNDTTQDLDLRIWKPRSGTLDSTDTGTRPTVELSNSSIEIPANDEGEPFLHYWVTEDNQLYGYDAYGGDFSNPEQYWVPLGEAPVGLPTEQGIHVNKESLQLYFSVDGQWASAGQKPANFDSAMPVNAEDGKLYSYYYVDKDRQMYGSNDADADFDNAAHTWTAVGEAPASLPAEQEVYIDKDSSAPKLHHNVPGEGWVPEGEGSMWFGGLKDAFGKGPASWLQGAPPFSEENSQTNLFEFEGPGGISVSA
ncbi:MAG: hypothetical protein AAFV29_16530, partial [Myxococcota bacterium]